MAVKIRLRRMGAKKRPFYRLVVADSRAPRDGRFIEKVSAITILVSSRLSSKSTAIGATHWLKCGARPSDTVQALLKKQGVVAATDKSKA